MTRETIPIDRRAAGRVPCAHLAEIRIGSTVTLRAIIKDLSEHGARLQIPENAWLPTKFELSVPGIGLNRRAICKWRRRDFAGLEFDIISK
jgi:hypothetical protein